jgi:hypothetical protein
LLPSPFIPLIFLPLVEGYALFPSSFYCRSKDVPFSLSSFYCRSKDVPFLNPRMPLFGPEKGENEPETGK